MSFNEEKIPAPGSDPVPGPNPVPRLDLMSDPSQDQTFRPS